MTSGDLVVDVTWSDALQVATRLGVAALGGLAVGIEREWSTRARARPARFAGVRTFLLIGLLGGLGATLSELAGPAIGLTVIAAAAALVVGAYIVTAAQGGDVDGTTEVSALVVLAAGAVAGTGRLALASALSALTVLVLVEKSRIHTLVHRLRSETIEAAARFAVLALVVLPLLPEGPFGPAPGLRPRELWALVLLFSGLSFGGFLALRLVGPDRGYALAGLLGGLVSSTAVTLSFSRESRHEAAPGARAGCGGDRGLHGPPGPRRRARDDPQSRRGVAGLAVSPPAARRRARDRRRPSGGGGSARPKRRCPGTRCAWARRSRWR